MITQQIIVASVWLQRRRVAASGVTLLWYIEFGGRMTKKHGQRVLREFNTNLLLIL
jgi:hypothetical protein